MVRAMTGPGSPDAKRPAPDSPRPYAGKKRGRKPGSPNRPKATTAPPLIKPGTMRVRAAVHYSGFSESYIRKQIRIGKLDSRLIDGVRLIVVRSLDALLGIE
jgi:hypothetical protein